jgi:hypothetical protein
MTSLLRKRKERPALQATHCPGRVLLPCSDIDWTICVRITLPHTCWARITLVSVSDSEVESEAVCAIYFGILPFLKDVSASYVCIPYSSLPKSPRPLPVTTSRKRNLTCTCNLEKGPYLRELCNEFHAVTLPWSISAAVKLNKTRPKVTQSRTQRPSQRILDTYAAEWV